MAAMPPRRSQAGFTLIELAIVLVVIGLLIGMFSHVGVGYLESKQREATQMKLDAVEEALVRFVAATRRLPCPADATAAAANQGVETMAGSNCTLNQNDGIVPWRTLGLSRQAAVDGWDNFFTFRVYDNAGGLQSLVAVGEMDMTACDPSLATGVLSEERDDCLVGTTRYPPAYFLQSRGLLVKDGVVAASIVNDPTRNTVDIAPTGAAYVLISHGRNGLGAYTQAGVLRAAPTSPDELQNANNSDIVQDVADGANSYVDTAIREVAPVFDDLVRHPTILDVVMKAGLGPRAAGAGT